MSYPTEIKFIPVGGEPETDAYRMHRLCTDEGVDENILNEFQSTVNNYSSYDIDKLINRIAEKYSCPYPEITGDIILYEEKEVGLAYSGIKNIFRPEPEAGEVSVLEGVNVSAWVLRTHRNLGVGRTAISYATERANARINNPEDTEWHERTIWTSINDDNVASQKACMAVGFSYAYPQVEEENRSIYLFS